jgi:hypothetical protein
MTARRRAALRKAQLASARKRHSRKISPANKRIIKNTAIASGVALAGGAAYGGSKKISKTRRVRAIDKMVAQKYGPGGSGSKGVEQMYGRKIASMQSKEVALRDKGSVDRRRGPMRPYIPGEPIPGNPNQEIFERSQWVAKKNKKTGLSFKSPHTWDEIRRRKRNAKTKGHWTNDEGKPINIIEAMRRTNDYSERMRRAGNTMNASHREMIYRMYRRMSE